MEMLKEFKSWLREPDSLWQIFSFDVADMTSESSRSDQNLVVAMVEWDHISTKEWVIQRRKEKERLCNLVHPIRHIRLKNEVLFALVAPSYRVKI